MRQFVEWTIQEPSIRVLVLIGSQARLLSNSGGADSGSDWDFQVVTTNPGKFNNSNWISDAGLSRPVCYVHRPARLGHVAKVSVLLEEATLDVVVLPFTHMVLLRIMYGAGFHSCGKAMSNACSSLSAVLRGGYLILKGSIGWRGFFRALQQDDKQTSLGVEQIVSLANGFVFDYISTCVKIRRGEYLAAQRWIHYHLAEVNFLLLQEVNQRALLPAFPDARRLESYCDSGLLNAVTVKAHPNEVDLTMAVETAAETHRYLLKLLVGDSWQWPDLPLRLRRE